MKQRIAVDMDEVIADALSAMLAAYNQEFEEALTLGDLRGRSIHAAIHPERRHRIDEYLRAEDFFRNLNVIPGSQEILAELSAQYEIFVTTAAMEYPTSFTAKYEWLREHFPFIPDSHFVFCGDKSIIHADFLIDDNARHFQNFIGQGILFTAPHNVHEERFPRVSTWQEVADYFRQRDE